MAQATATTKPKPQQQQQPPQRQPTTPPAVAVVESPPTAPRTEDYDYEELLKQYNNNKSNVIRFLSAEGLSRSEVSKVTGLRYQHVRNVLLMPVTKPRE